MPESSSAEAAAAPPLPANGWPRSVQAAMLLLNVLPFCHVAAVAFGTIWVEGAIAKAAVLFTGLYLVPPLYVRLLLAFRPLRTGSHRLDSPEFLHWWASTQGQVLFCRFPFLEEALRLVPGLYSAWLRLWGAKIGRLTYWAPGLRILDRSLLEIGHNVVFGAGVRLNSHVIAEDENGATCLHLGVVRIGHGCRIGGYALLTAGTVVEAGQTLKALSLSPPFTTWHHGRRARPAIPR